MATGLRGLESSIWSPSAKRAQSLPPPPVRATPSSTRQDRALARAQALHRFEHACGRLRWKSIDLENSFKRANEPEPWAFAATDAERNFKVDFHEFYVWIEQAVVQLLRAFGTAVEPTATNRSRNGRSVAAHAYHHNVLKALDDETHPLHATLGRGNANHALWKAKELRNRWKDAGSGRETPPLKMYHLEWIVTEAMRGLEAAYEIASARVRDDLATCQVHMTEQQHQAAVQDEWEWMVEPMDWEA